MKIQSIRVDGTERQHPVEVCGLEPGISVIHGENGSGKTVLVQFIRQVLGARQQIVNERECPLLMGQLEIEIEDAQQVLHRPRRKTTAGRQQPISVPGILLKSLMRERPGSLRDFPLWALARSLEQFNRGTDTAPQSLTLSTGPLPDLGVSRGMRKDVQRLRKAQDPRFRSAAQCWRNSAAESLHLSLQIDQIEAEREGLQKQIANLESQMETGEGGCHEPTDSPQIEPVKDDSTERIRIYQTALLELRREQSELLLQINACESGFHKMAPVGAAGESSLELLAKQIESLRDQLENPIGCDPSRKISPSMETVADQLSRLHQQCGLLQRRTELDARLHALRQSEAALSQQLAQPALPPVDQTGSTTIPCDAQQTEIESRIMELQGHREDLACELAALSYQWLENRTEQVGLEEKVTLPWSDSAVQHAINRLRGFDEQSALWLNGSHSIESSLIQSLREQQGRITQIVVNWLSHAAALCDRLTGGQITGFDWSPRLGLLVLDPDDGPIGSDRLSLGLRNQVELAWQLTVLSSWRDRGLELPLLLDDAFAHYDEESLESAVELLCEEAEAGLQIICLTCHDWIAQRLSSRGIHRIDLGEPEGTEEDAEPVEEAADASSVSDDAQDQIDWKVPALGALTRQALRRTRRAPTAGPSGPRFLLDPDSSISLCPDVDPTLADRFDRLKVCTANDLLKLTPDGFLADHPQFPLKPVDMYALQAQTLMMIRIPMLDEEASRCLVECGIVNTGQLSGQTAANLQQRMVVLFTRQNLPLAKRVALLRQSAAWIRRARHARSVNLATTVTTKLNETVDESTEMDPLVEGNPGVTSESPLPVRSQSASLQQFHLHPGSPIEDAPEIGSRMSERLEDFGIQSVQDLMDSSPDVLAEWIADRRVKPKRIRRWQMMAAMVCRIPGLQAHDVQILTACKVNSTEELAACNPDDLLAVVSPFAQSKRGLRILRGRSAPDLDAVTEWINAARNARTLKAA